MSMINELIEKVKAKNPGEPEFHQAVKEVLETLEPTVKKHPEFVKAKIYERIVEPDRAIMFRVPWVDDKGEVQVNRGFRVQFNNAIGPYKGGLRFHPSVNLGIIKFLGFEQIFKNSLTTLPMGGGKGGSDFDPKGKSDMEVMRFCQAFMRELFRHIGADVDVPAGDIGVGGREIGFLYGYYKKIRNEHTGVLTGHGLEYGGSPDPSRSHRLRLGLFRRRDAGHPRQGLQGHCAAPSAARATSPSTPSRRSTSWAARCITLSDSNGTIVDEEGIDAKKLAYVIDLKEVQRGRIKEYAAKHPKAKYFEGKSVWDVIKDGLKIDVAFPSATQNEIDEEHAKALVKNGCFCVSEGANMPSNLAAIKVYQGNNVLYGPGQGGQRRRRGHLRPGDGAAEPAPLLEPRGGRPEAARHHEEHPQAVPGCRRKLRQQGRLPDGRQHRRLHQGRQGHAGLRHRLI